MARIIRTKQEFKELFRTRKLPVAERIRTEEVKKLVGEYIDIIMLLGDYHLMIKDFMLGGEDDNEIVVFHDGLSHKPILIDYSKED